MNIAEVKPARPQLDRALVRQLVSASGGAINVDVPLSRVSRWRIGGTAAAIVEPGSADDVSAVMRALSGTDLPVCVVGETSNLLFDSAGFDGVLVRIGRRMSKFSVAGTRVSAQGGASVPGLSRAVGSAGLSGIEHTIGIPGTIGGLVLMNGGSQRKGIGLNVESVTVVDRDGDCRTLDREGCGFGYRESAIQGSEAIVVGVELTLEPADPNVVQRTMREIMLDRLGKFPSSQPNCGSTFLSDPTMYATVGPPGRAIEAAGLKGTRRGGAQISAQHANFIVNTGGATSDDVLWLIALARSKVQERTGYAMDCEAKFVERGGRVRPAHEMALERWGKSPEVPTDMSKKNPARGSDGE